jgi:hypothetical protein
MSCCLDVDVALGFQHQHTGHGTRAAGGQAQAPGTGTRHLLRLQIAAAKNHPLLKEKGVLGLKESTVYFSEERGVLCIVACGIIIVVA